MLSLTYHFKVVLKIGRRMLSTQWFWMILAPEAWFSCWSVGHSDEHTRQEKLKIGIPAAATIHVAPPCVNKNLALPVGASEYVSPENQKSRPKGVVNAN